MTALTCHCAHRYPEGVACAHSINHGMAGFYVLLLAHWALPAWCTASSRGCTEREAGAVLFICMGWWWVCDGDGACSTRQLAP